MENGSFSGFKEAIGVNTISGTNKKPLFETNSLIELSIHLTLRRILQFSDVSFSEGVSKYTLDGELRALIGFEDQQAIDIMLFHPKLLSSQIWLYGLINSSGRIDSLIEFSSTGSLIGELDKKLYRDIPFRVEKLACPK